MRMAFEKKKQNLSSTLRELFGKSQAPLFYSTWSCRIARKHPFWGSHTDVGYIAVLVCYLQTHCIKGCIHAFAVFPIICWTYSCKQYTDILIIYIYIYTCMIETPYLSDMHTTIILCCYCHILHIIYIYNNYVGMYVYFIYIYVYVYIYIYTFTFCHFRCM